MSTKTPRNPWPIAIIGYFIVFAAFIAAYTTFAFHQKMDLVSDNYYDAEIRFQKQIERISRTRLAMTSAMVNYDAARQAINIKFPPAQTKLQPYGKIELYRPSDSNLDREIRLDLDQKGAQVLDASQLQPGFWKVRLQWTAAGKEYFFDQPVTVVKK